MASTGDFNKVGSKPDTAASYSGNLVKHVLSGSGSLEVQSFEAFLSTSWQAVELMKIESGTITLHFADNHYMTMEKGLFSDVRIRSRKATSSDCSNFLRPGVDVCVLSPSQLSDNADEVGGNQLWIDAKINSIQRKPHNSVCSCQYYVNCYVEQGSLGTEIRTLSKELKVVGINEITILQKLERNSCENQHYRWESSEDCSTVLHSKLLFGKFLSDLSWLVVTSVVKKVSFCAISLENKIVYQMMGSDATSSSSNTESHISVVNFKVDKEGKSLPVVYQVDVSDTNRSGHAHDDEVSPSSYVVENLRRSKRRNMQPERYVGCDNVSEIKVGNVRTWPYKFNKGKDEDDDDYDYNEDEEPLPLAQENCIEEDGGNNQKVKEVSSCWEIIVYRRRKKTCVNECNQNERQTQLASVALLEGGGSLALEHLPLNDKVTRSKAHNSTRKPQRKRLEDDADYVPGMEGINFNQGVGEKRHSSWYSRSRNHDAGQAYKDRSLNADAYKKMIDSYFKDINRIPTKEELPITDQWKEISNMGEKKEAEIPQREDEKEISEMDMLWEEMEMALTSSYFEEMKGSNGANFAETTEESNDTCQHDFRLNEEIGIYCYRCGFVKTEIKHVTPPFMEVQHLVRHQEEKQYSGKASESKAEKDDDFHLFSTRASSYELVTMEHDNVWKLIPELREKMHVHQKKAFEFLWQNIGGSMEPTLMEAESKRRGGCVISHAPGAGKTFLIIAFLISYLKLFPGKKPLVLAPKTILHTWYQEFIKWNISLPVYLIHGRGKRDFNQNSIVLPGVPNPSKDVKHVLDCLDKIKKWQEHPSVLVMSYSKFLSLTREGSEFAHRKYMDKALREGPGVLILDEGHNPRSTKSRLRKCLMKVETDLRILLSGTLFQNNFCEYFNSLCLARPKFIHEVLSGLDPNHQRKRKTAGKARHKLESRARKLFLDNIAKKIDSGIGKERMEGLNMLREITYGFIDVYESCNFESAPGLQIYTLLMNSTDMQREILLKLHTRMSECIGYPLELELLVTLGSIHPWLVQTVTCANKFFTLEQLKQLEKCKFDVRIGSKVKFVLSLVFRVMMREKVLIFCHNIAPIKLLIELFEMFFKWEKDREILSLNGELDLFERGKVIDKFEDPRGGSKVLLASITACAEGISLTAASRVVFLDSEWNPSKTKQAIARAFRPGQQKMVYVYQLLATGTLEEDKYRRTAWKEWVSSMIFSEAFDEENPSQWQAEKIEDDVLREMVEEDKSKSIHVILKNEKASTN
ncbi:hypothetical protein Fmac_014663 [Flemingia macrophylla]|uniref:Uncharacterized protein n=1 Tax=Flemingia macrophylla TaxID=520843 RepID=A0ABD1MCE3_9FABA